MTDVYTMIQDYDFDYEDDEEEEPDVDLENKYYNAKGTDTGFLIDTFHQRLNHCAARKEDDPKEALVEFQSVIDTEEEKGDW